MAQASHEVDTAQVPEAEEEPAAHEEAVMPHVLLSGAEPDALYPPLEAPPDERPGDFNDDGTVDRITQLNGHHDL